MHRSLLKLLFPLIILVCPLVVGLGFQNGVESVEDAKLRQTEGYAAGDARLAGKQRRRWADVEDFGSTDGGGTTCDEKGDIVRPAPEQGSVGHLEQGRSFGTAVELQRLEEQFFRKIAEASDRVVEDPEADRIELWQLVNEHRDLQRGLQQSMC